MQHRYVSKNIQGRIPRCLILSLCFSLAFTPATLLAQDSKSQKPDQDNRVRTANYELAARWTTQKVGKLVFDTSVTPHWLETTLTRIPYDAQHLPINTDQSVSIRCNPLNPCTNQLSKLLSTFRCI